MSRQFEAKMTLVSGGNSGTGLAHPVDGGRLI